MESDQLIPMPAMSWSPKLRLQSYARAALQPLCCPSNRCCANVGRHAWGGGKPVGTGPEHLEEMSLECWLASCAIRHITLSSKPAEPELRPAPVGISPQCWRTRGGALADKLSSQVGGGRNGEPRRELAPRWCGNRGRICH